MRRDWVWSLCAVALLSACGRDHGAPTSSAHPTSRANAATSSRAVVPESSAPPSASSADAPPAKTELEAAFRAAYGKPSPVTAQDPGGTLTFKPAGLVDVNSSAGVVVLVSLGENQDNCHACSGSLSVRYLKRTSAGFKPWGMVDDYVFSGDGFGAPPQWSVRRDLEDNPVLAIETSFTGQGCTSAAQDLVELTPEGAKMRVKGVPVLYDNSGAYNEGDPQIVTLNGEIRPVVKGQRFEVVFQGTKSLRLVYERSIETYVTKDTKPDLC